jgi:hypothetical protein
MIRPMRPVVVRRPRGAPLLRGAIVGGAAHGTGRRAARGQDLASELNRLGELVQQGLLTPDEFSTAKARLLSG